ncbi:MAG: TraM recognition domain-containing protein [Myxococcota bacterium]
MRKESILHRRPWVAPLFASLSVGIGAVLAVRAARQIPAAWRRILTWGAESEWWRTGGTAVLVVLAIVLVVEQRRRFQGGDRAMPLYLLMNRALFYGFWVTAGVLGLCIAEEAEVWSSLLTEGGVAGSWYGAYLLASSAVGVVALAPLGFALKDELEPYQSVIEKQRDTFDFTVGIRRVDDWEHAARGKKEYVTVPEAGMYGNLLCLGNIGSGKTSQIIDPLMLQAMMKMPGDAERRPSIVVLDLKGNQSARYYKWAKALGRAHEFFVVRPDHVKDPKGRALIPPDRYCSFNGLGGWEETDLLAIEVVDALESTKRRPSPDFFVLVQQEFLTHTLRILTAMVSGEVDLGDLAAFTSSPEMREMMLKDAEGHPELERSVTYFREEFMAMKREDQASLLRGLASQLTLLTNRAVERAFCPKRTNGETRIFKGWNEDILNAPGIVVFSCPPAMYTDGLSRLLGLLFLKSFQQAMLRRTDAGFAGNRVRPVVLAIDEAHAFLNPRLGDFMSVSREAKVSTWLLTQAMDQIAPEYRGTVLSNTRTQIFLQVSGDTAKEVSPALGTISEVKEQVSLSEGLQGAQDGVLLERKVGERKSLSASRSFVEKERPRFAPAALQHLEQFRAVIHVFDGTRQLPSEKVETMPWYRLPYYPLDPLRHPNIQCPSKEMHRYRRDASGLKCGKCGHRLTESWEKSDFKAAKPAIRRLQRARRAA